MWDIDFTHEKSVSLVVLKQLSRAISLNFHNCKEVLVVLTLINKVSLIWLIVLAFSAHSLSRIGCGRFFNIIFKQAISRGVLWSTLFAVFRSCSGCLDVFMGEGRIRHEM